MARLKKKLNLFLLISLVHCGQNKIWHVVTSGLPEKITVDEENLLLTSYILKQTHLTLFEKNKNDSYSSRIIDTWSRDLQNKSYNFCINKQKTFSDNIYFGVNELQIHIDNILKKEKLKYLYNYKIYGNCLQLSFRKSFCGKKI
jgi:hypothetical protein